jgi:hypothetical protein
MSPGLETQLAIARDYCKREASARGYSFGSSDAGRVFTTTLTGADDEPIIKEWDSAEQFVERTLALQYGTVTFEDALLH